MAWCLNGGAFASMTYNGDGTFTANWVPANPSSTGYHFVFIQQHVSGLASCVGWPFVVVTAGEWDSLRELSVINQTLKDELASTRATIASKSDEVKAATNTAASTVANQVLSDGVESRMYDGQFYTAAAILLSMAVGLWLGYRWTRAS